MLALAAAIALVLSVSLVLGTAILTLSGIEHRAPLAAPVGFAGLLVLAGLCIHLPGRAATCAVIVTLVTLVSLAYVVRAPGRSPFPLWTVSVAAAAVLAALIPFAAAGHVGLLGVGTNDDMSEHLLAAWSLQAHAPIGSASLIGSGYPIGPHAIAAAISTATGMSLERAFTGLIVGVPALLALAAAAAIPGASQVGRSIVAVAVGLCYLQAAFLVQASFKETTESVILVASVAALYQAKRGQNDGRLRLVPLAVLGAGSVYVNSYLGVLWPAGTLLVWCLAAIAIERKSRRELRMQLRALSMPIAVGGLVFLILILPELPRMISFSHSAYNHEGATVFGNLLHRLSPLESLGIWPRLDFRFGLPLGSGAGILAIVAVPVLVVATFRSVARRELALPCALVTSWLLFAVTSGRSPYTAAKALVIGAPLATLMLGRELLVLWRASRRMKSPALLFAGLISVLLAAGAYSSLQVLRDGPVGPASHPDQLASLKRSIGHDPTLFLGADDYVHWELRGAEVATPPQPLYTRAVVPLRRTKAQPDPGDGVPTTAATRDRLAGVGVPFDFDSVPTVWLDRFTYAIRPRSGYLNPAPSNWKLIRTTTSYELWKRSGRTDRYLTLDETANPGALLTCTTPLARALADKRGVAMTEPKPVVGPRSSWRGAIGYAGRSARQTLDLGAGSWVISLQYDSVAPISITAAGLRAVLPPTLEPLAPDWYVGVIGLARPSRVQITVTYQPLPRAARLLGALGLTRAPAPTGLSPLGRVTASRPPWAHRLVPLSQACGRYVDWYRVA
jgi:hypothetical protein